MQPNDENVPKDLNSPPLENTDKPTTPDTGDQSTPQATSAPEIITPTQTEEVQDTPSTESTPSEPASPVTTPSPEVITPTTSESESENPSPEATSTEQPEAAGSPQLGQAAAGAAGASGVVAAAAPSAGSGKGKRGKLKLLIVGVIVVLLLAAGSAGAYLGLVLPNQPQRITQDAISNTINAEKFKSSKFEGEISFSGGDISKTVSGITFEGAANESNALDLKLSVNTAVTKIGFDVRSTDSKTIYLKLSGLTGLDKLLASAAGEGGSAEAAMIAQFAPLLAQVNDQWFFIDESLLNQVSGENPLVSGEKISSEDAKKIGEIYKKNQFLNIDKRLADQDIHGVASYHIQVTINKDKLKGFLQELKSANIKDLELEQKDIDSLNDVDFSKYPFEMWVSKKDRFLTQVATTIEDSGTTAKIRLAIFDINKPVTVEKPADAKSVLELLGGVSPLLMGGLGAEEPDAEGAVEVSPELGL